MKQFEYFPDVPDQPESPKADRITKNSVTLSWRPPRHDGGAKIKGYILQKKAKGEADWSDVNIDPINSTVYKVRLYLIYWLLLIKML